MSEGKLLSPAELVRLRRQVGLPDRLPSDQDGEQPVDRPRCACGCGSWVRRNSRGQWSVYLRGHAPK